MKIIHLLRKWTSLVAKFAKTKKSNFYRIDSRIIFLLLLCPQIGGQTGQFEIFQKQIFFFNEFFSNPNVNEKIGQIVLESTAKKN